MTDVPGGPPGRGIRRASWWGTAALLVAAASGVAVEDLRPAAAAVALLLFVAGIAAFLWAFGVAVGRSRTDAIGIGGLFFLAGQTAPPRVRRSLMGALALQVVVSLGAASARPFTSLAFAVLAPMWGLGLAGLWGARHGRFGRRSAVER